MRKAGKPMATHVSMLSSSDKALSVEFIEWPGLCERTASWERRPSALRCTSTGTILLKIVKIYCSIVALFTSKNEVWVGDITFIKVNKEWSYLSVVMDLHTRKIIGWTFEKKRSADMVSESLIMAANDNRYTSSTIFHSDQGSEYASRKYIKELDDRNIQASMSRKGHCWDNAYMESFFHSLKTEMIYFNHFKTLEEATAYIIDYIYFYNHERLHSGLGYQTPAEYERIVA